MYVFSTRYVRYNQNTFTGLTFSNFTIFAPKIGFKFFGKLKIIKAVSNLKIYRFVVNTLTHCTMLLGNKLLGEKKIIASYLIFLFISIWRWPIPLLNRIK